MRKTLLKIGFIVFCVGAAIFLLLPFLETSGPVTSSLNTGEATIATENPLNVIAKRLASLFGRKEKEQKNLNAQSNATNALLMAGLSTTPNGAVGRSSTTNGKNMPAAAHSHVIQVPRQDASADYDGASFQTDEGEWVLIQQIAPQNSAPGMHEINVHENPYDRYVRQERAKHFTPQQEAKQDIPDSKWARLVQPIKNFFGFSAPLPVSPAAINVQKNDEKLASLGSANNKLNSGINKPYDSSAYSTSHSPIPGISMQQWLSLSPEEQEQLREDSAARNFADILTGRHAAREAAEVMADIQMPNPKNEQEKQQKEELTQKLTAENMEQIRQRAFENIFNRTEGITASDEVSTMLLDCVSSIPANACSWDGTPPAAMKEDEIQKIKEENSQKFFEQTLFKLPEGLPVTVILAPTSRENFQQLLSLPDDQNPHNQALKKTAQIYDSMFEQQHCDSKPCYYLPNSDQSDPQLNDTFKMVGGARVKSDPYNTYPTYKEKFIQSEKEKRKKANPNATAEEQRAWEEELEKQWEQNKPYWVPYTDEQIRQLHKDNVEALTATPDRPSDKHPIFPVVTDPGITRDIAELTSPVGFVWNQRSWTEDPGNPITKSSQLTDSLIANVNDAKEIVQEVWNQPIQGSVRDLINKASEGGFDSMFNSLQQGGKGNSPSQK